MTSSLPAELAELGAALRRTWAADTCSPDDAARWGWHPDNPALGHCDLTTLVVNDFFGGELRLAEVFRNGQQEGFHYWNRLPGGLEVDLTYEQFQHGEELRSTVTVHRPPGPLRRRWAEYELLRERLSTRLGPLPPPGGS